MGVFAAERSLLVSCFPIQLGFRTGFSAEIVSLSHCWMAIRTSSNAGVPEVPESQGKACPGCVLLV